MLAIRRSAPLASSSEENIVFFHRGTKELDTT
jgi:hypothetical protein